MNSCTVPSGTFMYKDSPYERSRVRLKKKTIYLLNSFLGEYVY